MPDEACAEIGATNYRWSHRGLLSGIHGEGRRAVPAAGAPLPDWGPLLGDRLLVGATAEPARRGGILLPISRSLQQELRGLELAAELALAHQCTLLVICSRQAKVAEFPRVLSDKLGDLLVLVDLAEVDRAWLPTLVSSAHRVSKLRRVNDVGSKRNIGLAVAICLRWNYLLFVDDDIHTAERGPSLDPENLAYALGVLEADRQLSAVGWTLEGFDDNSVVGHARPLVGLPQGIFIGGGALLVRIDEKIPFFPDIYNEDWMFVIALAAAAPDHRRALGWGGRVHQRAYAPFRARRAASEEAGDIVGECLMNLLEDYGSKYDQIMTPSLWRSSISSRRQLLQVIRVEAGRRLRAAAAAGAVGAALEARCLIDSMTAAERVHQELKPMDLMSFVRAWRDDAAAWQSHLRQVQNLLGPCVQESELRRGLIKGMKWVDDLALSLSGAPEYPGSVKPPTQSLRRPVGAGRSRWATPKAAELEAV